MKIRNNMTARVTKTEHWLAGTVKAGTMCKIRKVKVSYENKNDCLDLRECDCYHVLYILDVPRKNKRYCHAVTEFTTVIEKA